MFLNALHRAHRCTRGNAQLGQGHRGLTMSSMAAAGIAPAPHFFAGISAAASELSAADCNSLADIAAAAGCSTTAAAFVLAVAAALLILVLVTAAG